MRVYKSDEWFIPSEAIGITKSVCNSENPERLHSHEFIELVYILSGEGTHCIDGIPYSTCRGSLLFINYNSSHSFHTATAMEYINILIKPEFISKHLADSETIDDIFSFLILDRYFEGGKCAPIVSFSGRDMLEVEETALRMVREARERRAGYTVVMDGCLRIIFAMLIRRLGSNRTNTEYRRTVTPELLRYIDENYTKPLTLSDLANRCFYNPAYLGRLFKSSFGISLHEYIGAKRLTLAKKLLTETDEKIDAIAEKSGFADKRSFYKIFKEKTGCTPNEYRIGRQPADS